MKKTNILFPIEVTNRDLDSKLFLACLAVEKHSRVLVGQHDAVRRLVPFMRGGIYLGKELFPGGFPGVSTARYDLLKQRGFRAIYLDEEGGIYAGGPTKMKEILDFRLDPRVLADDDHICAWGTAQRDHFLSRGPKCRDNIRATGHPRFDLLKEPYREFFAKKVREYRTRFGGFILVNTNLTLANNGVSYHDTFTERSCYFPHDRAARAEFINRWHHSNVILGSIVKLINTLCQEFPDTNIVLRPHPGEDRYFYRQIFSASKNVHVIHEGGVNAWLLACDILIHNGCTTAFESWFAGTRVICYQPYKDAACDLFLPNLIGTPCANEAEAVASVKNLQRSKEPTPVRPAIMTEGLAVNQTIASSGFDAVLEVIRKAESGITPSDCAFDSAAFWKREIAHRVFMSAKKLVRPLFPNKQKLYEFFSGAGNFPGFEASDIGQRMGVIQKILKKKIRWRFHNEELISVEKD